MKLFKISALALLLSMPSIHAGCDGYENWHPRNAEIGMAGAGIFTGTAMMIYGIRRINHVADRLANNSLGEPLITSDTQPNLNAQGDIKNALFVLTCGAFVSFMSFVHLVGNESLARSNCCDALPTNSTCDWNK